MITHIVKRGENLLTISQRYGVSIRSIVDQNKITNAETYEGDRLSIPVSTDSEFYQQTKMADANQLTTPKPNIQPRPKKPSPFSRKRKRFFWA
ncbi:LysM peptidoglycan-binding domain-containing protein [Chengkuizengella marina]|uniref:LysM peptidoglycan-binding domain-containing protein n=1 Tax=Chengkuizengella marina TaxID=2507566 RepID=A0A6N9Q5T1_9BACL|nr:LysM peptidoglycan-binding domain-containing protein [Chengkuizengella marina]NBI30208.1 LysM peptidoglycan-binding domain-containing protein [Chengkuizengella marina]